MTYDDQHASTKDSGTSNSTDRSSKDQNPHVGCYTTNERSELKDEYSKDDDMFRREDLEPLRVDEIESK